VEEHAPDAGEVMSRLGALVRKELRQIRRDRRLVFSLIGPPLLQILLFGYALDADVNNLRIGVVDTSRSSESRELVADITSTRVFRMNGYFSSVADLEAELNRSRLDVGLVIPADFDRKRARNQSVQVQLVLNAVNANTATIAEGYTRALISSYNQRHSGDSSKALPVAPSVALLYNPGLEGSWFIVTGVFGILLVLNGTLVAAAALIREKESGTVEQLLMTPASSTEVIVAKIAPLFLLLMGTATLVMIAIRLVFGVPVRGNPLLLTLAAALCVLTGIALGTLLSTFSRSAQQAQLLALFINPPLAVLSGALTPIEAMPVWLQPVTLLNPVRHFALISRGVLLKGSGICDLYPNILALAAFAFTLLAISVWRFRKQLT
jgi:ABC-2 type transport system permease protein